MDAESFFERIRAIGDKYLGAASTSILEPKIRSEVTSEVFHLYAEGGFICDREGEPVYDLDEVNVPVSDLALKYSIPANTLRFRLLKGWSFEKVVSTPVRPKKPNHA